MLPTRRPPEHCVNDQRRPTDSTPVSAAPGQESPRAPERISPTERLIRERIRGIRPGNQVVRLRRPEFEGFVRLGRGHLEAGLEIERPRGLLGLAMRALVGKPIHSQLERHERLSKVKALAVFSSDALSSVAYAPEAVLLVLLAAGTGAIEWMLPISVAVVLLLATVATSYRQTIHTYPGGGGSYIVARANLGELPGLVAAAALSVGYILTVSVSIASGVDQLVSAVQGLAPYRLWLAVGAIALVTLANLRGIRESGTIFTVPTYVFLLAMYGLIGSGLFLLARGDLTVPPAQPPTVEPAPFGVFLLLRAFAVGSAVMTGTEAISNGVPAFKPPEARNAARTLVVMATILGSMFLGLTFLIVRGGIVPGEDETVISLLGRAVFGEGALYYVVLAATALILVLAANTAFADFPRLSSLLARDGYAPRQLAFRGDRLAFSNGILLLGLLASVLVIMFGGRIEALLPLYAVSVFLAFTLNQAGMVRHWWKERGPGWRLKMAVNGAGATATAIVTLTATTTNFVDFASPIIPGAPFGWWGAWIVVVVVPALMQLFLKVRAHYEESDRALALPPAPEHERALNHIVVVPVSRLNRATVRALQYASSLSPSVTAVHVALEPDKAAGLEAAWPVWGHGVPLVIVESPYRSLTRPLLRFLVELKRVEQADMVTVVLPEFVPDSWWEHTLHNQSALFLKAALLFTPGFAVTSVPVHA